MTLIKHLLIILVCVGLFTGCTLHINPSKAGKGRDKSEQSINITQFENSSGLGPSDIIVTFTEKTKDYYQQNAKLDLVEKNGDIDLVCNITGYTLSPVAAANNQQASLTQLRITVRVDYTRNLFPNEPNNLKGQSFAFFKNFDANEDFNSIEAELVDEISDQIIINIFNATIGYW